MKVSRAAVRITKIALVRARANGHARFNPPLLLGEQSARDFQVERLSWYWSTREMSSERDVRRDRETRLLRSFYCYLLLQPLIENPSLKFFSFFPRYKTSTGALWGKRKTESDNQTASRSAAEYTGCPIELISICGSSNRNRSFLLNSRISYVQHYN